MTSTALAAPGRTCPIAYRYGPAALAQSPAQAVETLYVIGGLYGNLPALAAIEAMAAREPGPVTLCFNGDFNWFNVDDAGFVATNRSALAHDAIQGNVEAELLTPVDDAGCGCAYPEHVDAGTVARSNLIHARLKTTACRYPEILERLRALPMFRRYRLGDCIVGVVHGDAESLAGWRFDAGALDDPGNRPWLAAAFAQATVDVFASTHTCLPALRRFHVGGERKFVINNGAAGMPNFAAMRSGLITRIGIARSPCPPLYGEQVKSAYIDALPVVYDHAEWENLFLANWPKDSPAYVSYYNRIINGPAFESW
jgi:hypothetical protein